MPESAKHQCIYCGEQFPSESVWTRHRKECEAEAEYYQTKPEFIPEPLKVAKEGRLYFLETVSNRPQVFTVAEICGTPDVEINPRSAQEWAAHLCLASNLHRELVDALRDAEEFIANGIEMGYIRLPEYSDDKALKTLPAIRAVLAKLKEGASP